jgi:hypothetical protein
MVPSWTEAGARLMVTRFLNQYVTIGNMMWVHGTTNSRYNPSPLHDKKPRLISFSSPQHSWRRWYYVQFWWTRQKMPCQICPASSWPSLLLEGSSTI